MASNRLSVDRISFGFDTAGLCGFRPEDPWAEPCCLANADECWFDRFLANVLNPRPPVRHDLCCDAQVTLRLEGNSPGPVVPQDAPSSEQPIVFLHDPRTGGTTFERILARACASLGLPSLITGVGWSIAGTPFFAKFFPPAVRQTAACVGGHYDWDMVSTDALACGTRACTCIVTLRHPVQRFLSYYAKRSELQLGTSWANLHPTALKHFLQQSSPERLAVTREEGVACSGSIGICLRGRANSTGPLRPHAGLRQRWGTKLGLQYAAQHGPLNSLSRMLDPEGKGVDVALRRLNACIPLLLTERFADSAQLAAHYFPFMNLQLEERRRDPATGSRALSADLAQRPDLVRLIEQHNEDDMRLYRFGKRRFERLLQPARRVARERSIPPPSRSGDMPRIIWSYWEGLMPPIIAMCIGTWRHKGFDVRILTPWTATQLSVALEFASPARLFPLEARLRVDWLKAHVLQAFGGLWLEPDMVVTSNRTLESFFARLQRHEVLVRLVRRIEPARGELAYGSQSTLPIALAARPVARAIVEWVARQEEFRESGRWDAAILLSFMRKWMASGYPAQILSAPCMLRSVSGGLAQMFRALFMSGISRSPEPFLSLGRKVVAEVRGLRRRQIFLGHGPVPQLFRLLRNRTVYQDGRQDSTSRLEDRLVELGWRAGFYDGVPMPERLAVSV